MQHNSYEPAGRGLRASVILASIVVCAVLFLGIQGIFRSNAKGLTELAPERGSSFSTISKQQNETGTDGKADEEMAIAGNSSAEPVTAVDLQSPRITQPTVRSYQQTTPPLPDSSSSGSSGSGLPRLNPTAPVIGAATIYGRITLTGKPAPETSLPADASCGGAPDSKSRTTRNYVVGPDNGLADVLVYISKGLEKKSYSAPLRFLELHQTNCLYVPYVSAAQTGQFIQVHNHDPVLHNVHPTPSTAGNGESNKVQAADAPPLYFHWNKDELFLRFKCDVHPWMFAYVSLLPHPYFAVTDTNGVFSITNVPPGDYHVKVLHRKAESITLDVRAEANGLIEINENIRVLR